MSGVSCLNVCCSYTAFCDLMKFGPLLHSMYILCTALGNNYAAVPCAQLQRSEEADTYLRMAESLQTHLDNATRDQSKKSKGKAGPAPQRGTMQARRASSNGPAPTSKLKLGADGVTRRTGSFTAGSIMSMGSGGGNGASRLSQAGMPQGGVPLAAVSRARRSSASLLLPGPSGHFSGNSSQAVSPVNSMSSSGGHNSSGGPMREVVVEQFFYIPDKKALPWANQSCAPAKPSPPPSSPSKLPSTAARSSPLQPWTSKSSPMRLGPPRMSTGVDGTVSVGVGSVTAAAAVYGAAGAAGKKK